MKLFATRTAFGLALATLLAACGSGAQDDATIQTMALSQTSAQVVAQNAPAPDCAAENCEGLRIIDANAEAYRYDALRRAADEPQS